jgi:hypothetical protein
MSGQLAPAAIFQGLGPGGVALVGGQLGTFAAGTNTPLATFADFAMTQVNTNPVILNANGQAVVWLDPTLSYKFVLSDSNGNLVYTMDNIQGALANPGPVVIGAPASGNTALTVRNVAGSDAIDIPYTQTLGAGFALNINASTPFDLRAIEVTNSFAGTTASALGLTVNNDGVHALTLGKTSSAFSGSKFTNSPAGELAWLQSGGPVPLSLVTQNSERLGVSGAGNITAQAPDSGVTLTVNGLTANAAIQINQPAATTCINISVPAATQVNALQFQQGSQPQWEIYQPATSSDIRFFNVADQLTLTSAGALKATGPMGMNGVTPPAQSTGWGTPTGASVAANFAGASATLPQTSAAVAELITLLKAFGLLGA